MHFKDINIYYENNNCRSDEPGFFLSDQAKLYFTYKSLKDETESKFVYEGKDVTRIIKSQVWNINGGIANKNERLKLNSFNFMSKNGGFIAYTI